MIGRLSGILIEKNPPQILVDAGGVGYELDVPMSTFYDLPATGEPVVLRIHHAVREDGQFLYGFFTEGERTLFRQLIRISGIGAKIALAALSGLSLAEFSAAIARQEAGRLIKIPGIGKKTAERILLELKGKLPTTGADAQPGETTVARAEDDVVSALVALGYADKEARAAQAKLPADLPTPEAIRQALKLLAKLS
ncbi:MAG: Holliday junction branch migration protein RuvA [Zoogloeaceae bacterium]|jgi:Holliday junction DNA helicase RuvA|nr:Holliday junction branch migration protein RuvA [Zoogloeaceae bacterium]